MHSLSMSDFKDWCLNLQLGHGLVELLWLGQGTVYSLYRLFRLHPWEVSYFRCIWDSTQGIIALHLFSKYTILVSNYAVVKIIYWVHRPLAQRQHITSAVLNWKCRACSNPPTYALSKDLSCWSNQSSLGNSSLSQTIMNQTKYLVCTSCTVLVYTPGRNTSPLYSLIVKNPLQTPL